MTKKDLEKTILKANEAYRSGNPVMSDVDFDTLVEEYNGVSTESEYKTLRDSLNEGTIESDTSRKISHPEIMGSLDKLKVEEPEEIIEFINSKTNGSINISAKVDGISCRLQYVNGKLTSASTRGDGYIGQKIDHIIKYVKNVPREITLKGTVNIRGELVILRDDFVEMCGYANPRNATAGIVNRIETSKEWNVSEIEHITFVAYTILGKEYGKTEQFNILKKEGFYTAWNTELSRDDIFMLGQRIVQKLSEFAEEKREYETDGLVASSSNYHNEDEYRPKSQKAIKLNQLVATTRLIGIDWSEVSKDGKVTCVGLIEPTQLGGSTISRVTLNNLDFIEKMDLRIGSTVTLVKRGDIIPAITGVVSNENTTKIEYPTKCPCCQSTLVREGPFLFCKNDECVDKTTTRVEMFLKNLGVENVNFKTLKNLGITNYEKLLSFVPNVKYKTEKKLGDSLKVKLFSLPKENIFCCIPMRDFGKKSLKSIVKFYGMKNIESGEFEQNAFSILPSGIGELTMDKFISLYKSSISVLNAIITDSRYTGTYTVPEIEPPKATKTNGFSICFTGALSIPRNKAKEIAENAGFEVKDSVTAGLTYLCQADKNSTSSKTKKAISLGTKIIDENEFMNIVG